MPVPEVLTVREAGPEDVATMADLYVELARHHALIQPANPRYAVAEEDWTEVVQLALQEPAQTVMVAERGDRVVGFVKLQFVQKPWGLSCEVQTLVVNEDHRGRGIGKVLMDAAERRAETEGAAGVRVDVLLGNEEAERFYERLGYKPIATRYGRSVPGAIL